MTERVVPDAVITGGIVSNYQRNFRPAHLVPALKNGKRGCDRCTLLIRPSDLVAPRADNRAWVHAACVTDPDWRPDPGPAE